jgi:hypothetical protein
VASDPVPPRTTYLGGLDLAVPPCLGVVDVQNYRVAPLTSPIPEHSAGNITDSVDDPAAVRLVGVGKGQGIKNI